MPGIELRTGGSSMCLLHTSSHVRMVLGFEARLRLLAVMVATWVTLRKAALMHARQSCSCVVRWKQQLSQAVLVASTLAAASMLFLAGSFFWVPFVVFPLFFLFAGIFSTHSRCKSFRCHVWYRSQGSPETHNSPAFLSIPLDITHSKRKARFFSRPLPFAGLRMGE